MRTPPIVAAIATFAVIIACNQEDPTSVSTSVAPAASAAASESWVITTYYWEDDEWVRHAVWDGSYLGSDLEILLNAWNWEPDYSGFQIRFDNVYAFGDIDLPEGLVDDFDDGVVSPIWEGGVDAVDCRFEEHEACEANGVLTIYIAERPGSDELGFRVAGIETRDFVIHGEFDVQVDFSVDQAFHDTPDAAASLRLYDEHRYNAKLVIRNGLYVSSQEGPGDYGVTHRTTSTDHLVGKLRITRTRARRPVVTVQPKANNKGTATTIQEGIDMVAPGGRVQILPGTYVEAPYIYKGVTLEAIGNGPVIVAPEPGEPGAAAIEVTATDPIVIRGLVIDCECGHGIKGQGRVDLTVEESTVLRAGFRPGPMGGGGVVAFNNAASTGGRARLVVRNSTFDGGASPTMDMGLWAATDVDARFEGNVVRRTLWSCIQVQGAAEADVIGNDVDECGGWGGIRVATGSVANVVGNTVRNSGSSDSSFGIVFFYGATGRIERNTIIDYVQPHAILRSPWESPAAIRIADDAVAVARFNDISGNALAGLYATTSATIDATCNWWGLADGPSIDGLGTGDAAIGNADWVPFATAPVAETDAISCAGGL